MLIYLDESYNNNRFLLGACFHPHPKFLHRKMIEIKRSMGFVDSRGNLLELKYNNCGKKGHLAVAKKLIDEFFGSTSYFRCIAIEHGADRFNYDMFGEREPKKMKVAIMYKKFTEMLIHHNTENMFNGVLLTDELCRCPSDHFFPLLKKDFCTPGYSHSYGKHEPTLKMIAEVKSDEDSYQLLQLTDILMGGILCGLGGVTNKYKLELSQYICQKTGIYDFLPASWNFKKHEIEERCPKFNVRFWKPKNDKSGIGKGGSDQQP